MSTIATLPIRPTSPKTRAKTKKADALTSKLSPLKIGHKSRDLQENCDFDTLQGSLSYEGPNLVLYPFQKQVSWDDQWAEIHQLVRDLERAPKWRTKTRILHLGHKIPSGWIEERPHFGFLFAHAL